MKYSYEIIRTSRKSISISISNRNKIVVRCPWEVSAAKINEFLDSKADWIDRVVGKNSYVLASNNDVIEHKAIYFKGKKLPLILSNKNEITADAVYIKRVDDIGKLLIKTCQDELFRQVDEISKVSKLSAESVRVRYYKGRWGCCDSKNNIVFNYIMFMLPPEVQRYIIVHELCHTICHNHSQAFWKLVADYEPDYEKLKKQLTAYNFLTTVY